MKNLALFLFVSSLFAVFVPPLAAQDKQAHTVTDSYDRFREMTVTALEDMLLLYNGDYIVHLSAGFPCKGRTPCKPESVMLLFVLTTKGKYEGNGVIRMIRDGVLSPPYTLKRLSTKQREELSVETLAVLMSPEAFLNIASSKKVEFQIDRIEFAFNESHLLALRDIASRIGK
jgi:hypothetical protein